jgi:uncharacterized protein YjgD (DUF1641 family)
MRDLKKDIEELTKIPSEKAIIIIFQIKSYFELTEIINKLKEAGYCDNYSGWEANTSTTKVAFNSQSSDYVELTLNGRGVTYSTTTKFEKELTKGIKKVLNTKDYIGKPVRKKLAF